MEYRSGPYNKASSPALSNKGTSPALFSLFDPGGREVLERYHGVQGPPGEQLVAAPNLSRRPVCPRIPDSKPSARCATGAQQGDGVGPRLGGGYPPHRQLPSHPDPASVAFQHLEAQHLAVVGEAGEGARLQQAGILCGRLPLAAQAHQCGGAGLLGHHQAGADVLEVDVCSAARLEGSCAEGGSLNVHPRINVAGSVEAQDNILEALGDVELVEGVGVIAQVLVDGGDQAHGGVGQRHHPLRLPHHRPPPQVVHRRRRRGAVAGLGAGQLHHQEGQDASVEGLHELGAPPRDQLLQQLRILGVRGRAEPQPRICLTLVPDDAIHRYLFEGCHHRVVSAVFCVGSGGGSGVGREVILGHVRLDGGASLASLDDADRHASLGLQDGRQQVPDGIEVLPRGAGAVSPAARPHHRAVPPQPVGQFPADRQVQLRRGAVCVGHLEKADVGVGCGIKFRCCQARPGAHISTLDVSERHHHVGLPRRHPNVADRHVGDFYDLLRDQVCDEKGEGSAGCQRPQLSIEGAQVSAHSLDAHDGLSIQPDQDNSHGGARCRKPQHRSTATP
mmetsp:Transcript_10137/g.30383  ORF Transcript_10137/g.30383 Transcript_10137/m.30383 type:complete len:561 (-) Transcript_10137:879-2561(-)